LSSPDALAYWLHLRVVGPLQWRRRKGRLHRFGEGAPPTARLRTRVNCEDARCAALADDSRRHLALFNTSASWRENGGTARPTPTLLPLNAFTSFAEFERAVARQTGGNANRSVRQALRKGYRSRIIERHSHARDIAAIVRSKLVRTGGPVLAALLPAKAKEGPQRRRPARSCTEHWSIAWGVFAPAADGAPEQLVAYAALRRTGNFVLAQELLGHGDFLREGVVKLLMFDIVRWLLAREEPRVAGVDYFKYGAVEDGAEGLVAWKRRLQFRPFVLG
jgi:hypothetical protein